MADEYPFIPYPFSEPAPPESVNPVQPVVPPFSLPPEQTAQETRPVSAFYDVDADDENKAAQKTALGIVAGVFVALLLVSFGIWYFLRDKGEGETPPAPPPQEEQEQNLILASVGGTVLTPEGAAIIIPPGALSQDSRVEIAKVSDGDVTDLFELKPLGLKFLKPVTVEIPYKKSWPIILEYWMEGGEKKVLKYTVDRKDRKLRTVLGEF